MSVRTITTGRIPVVVAAVVLAYIGYGASPALAQTPPARWTTTLERSFGPGWLQSIVALPGGGYVLAGHRGPPAALGLGTSVIRLDEKGGIVWEKTVEGRMFGFFGGSLSLAPRGRLMLIAHEPAAHHWVTTLDLDGKVLSDRPFGERGLISFRRTVMLADGGWVSSGEDNRGNPTLSRFDANGTHLRTLALQDPALNTQAEIARVDPSDVAVVWMTATDGGAKGRPRAVRFDAATLEPKWDIVIDLDAESEPGVSLVAPLSGGGLAIAGVMQDGVLWVAVIGADGRTQWLSRIKGRDASHFPLALAGLANGGVVVGGCAFTNDAKQMMPWFAVLDAKGNLASESVELMQNGGGVLALAALPTGEFAAAGISGNGCAFVEAGLNGANTWMRVMRP